MRSDANVHILEQIIESVYECIVNCFNQRGNFFLLPFSNKIQPDNHGSGKARTPEDMSKGRITKGRVKNLRIASPKENLWTISMKEKSTRKQLKPKSCNYKGIDKRKQWPSKLLFLYKYDLELYVWLNTFWN